VAPSKAAKAPPRPEASPPAKAPAASGPGADASEAEHLLVEARARGRHLTLPCSFEALTELRNWTAALFPPGSISDARFQLVSTAIYEVCANIAEHGCNLDSGMSYDLWWVPVADSTDQPSWLETSFPGELSPGASTRGPRATESLFLIRDHGIAFRADNWKQTDFRDPAVWKRGRGFGLDIIHGVMSRVVYQPGTPEGNLTLMQFDSSDDQRSDQEQRHVR
jgi:anti-sigma regulatory factor (Ser/Thr protein kinase)